MTTIVSHLGLHERDVRVIKTFIDLAPALKNSFRFVVPVEGKPVGQLADVVFVNADAADAMEQWNSLSQENRLITAIMVTSRASERQSLTTVCRPLVLKRIQEALETATGTASPSGMQGAAGKESDGEASLKVLVVDDSFPVRKYMEHKLPELVSSRISVEFAESGEQALEKVRGGAYDLVFLDVMMPGMDGYKACKRIKASSSVQVVMLTSKKSPFDKVRGAMSGCDAYITKPPRDERLKEVLERCLLTGQEAREAAWASG